MNSNKKNEFKKAELHYMSATTKTEPVSRVPVNSSKMHELDMSIREKCKQNHSNDHRLENNELYYDGIGKNFNSSGNESAIKTHTFYDILHDERTEEELIEYKRLIGMPITEDYDELIDSLVTPEQKLAQEEKQSIKVPNYDLTDAVEQGTVKKLSESRNSKQYLERKEGIKSEPISKDMQQKIELAGKNANKKISINNSIYNQSNAHSNETIVCDNESHAKKFVDNLENMRNPHIRDCVSLEEKYGTIEDYTQYQERKDLERYRRFLNSSAYDDVKEAEGPVKKLTRK